MYYIYKITNVLNGKSYVGFTKDLQRRWTNHKNSKLYRPLYQAFKKHGIENFTFEELYRSEDKNHVLLEMEPHYIEIHEAYTKGYNCTRGGEDTNSLDARKRSSERMKKNNPMKIMRTNRGTFKKGQKPNITENRNELIRQSKLGLGNPNYGNKEAANHLNSKNYTCQACGKSTNKGNYFRWHGDKCKSISFQSHNVIIPNC